MLRSASSAVRCGSGVQLATRRNRGPGSAERHEECRTAPGTHIKTPPGIGRRLESKCRGRVDVSLHQISVLVTGIDAVKLAQQRRPYQRGGAQFRAVGIAE